MSQMGQVLGHLAASRAPVACARLISRAFNQNELIFLIEAIFSDEEGIAVVRSLYGDDAQTFADIIDQVSCPLAFSLGTCDNQNYMHVLVTRHRKTLHFRRRSG